MPIMVPVDALAYSFDLEQSFGLNLQKCDQYRTASCELEQNEYSKSKGSRVFRFNLRNTYHESLRGSELHQGGYPDGV